MVIIVFKIDKDVHNISFLLLLFLFVVKGVELRSSCLLAKSSTT